MNYLDHSSRLRKIEDTVRSILRTINFKLISLTLVLPFALAGILKSQEFIPEVRPVERPEPSRTYKAPENKAPESAHREWSSPADRLRPGTERLFPNDVWDSPKDILGHPIRSFDSPRPDPLRDIFQHHDNTSSDILRHNLNISESLISSEAKNWAAAGADEKGLVWYIARKDLTISSTVLDRFWLDKYVEATSIYPFRTEWILDITGVFSPDNKNAYTYHPTHGPWQLPGLTPRVGRDLEPNYPFPKPNIIDISNDPYEGSARLSPFFAVNSRFLLDTSQNWLQSDDLDNDTKHKFNEILGNNNSTTNQPQRLPSWLRLSSPYHVLTVARLSDGTEMITLYDDTTRPVRGVRYTFTKANESKQSLKLLDQLRDAKRIYIYGPMPRRVNVSDIGGASRVQVIRRTTVGHRSLSEINVRLNQIAALRNLRRDKIKIVNGLPADVPSAKRLGIWSGSPSEWIAEHTRVEHEISQLDLASVKTYDGFIRELTSGNDNLLVFVAHSTGLKVFIGGRAISLTELQKLHSRPKDHDRPPRIAVLLSCDAGTEKPANRWWFSKREIPNLAEILISHNFADQVIAPNKRIKMDETLDVIKQVLSGDGSWPLPNGWLNYADEDIHFTKGNS